MAGTLTLTMSGLTDPGEVREGNEDAIRWSADNGWAVLADGMGGHMAGEVASQLAVETLALYLDALEQNAAPADVLREAVDEANRRIHEQANSDIRCHNMGTTIVAMLIDSGTMHCAHVGDSRLYRYRDGELAQLSHDHSLVQELVDEGMLSREEAAESTHKNVITRALGLEASVEVDLVQQPVQSGDCYLLCSDGLSDKIPDEEMAAYLAQGELDAVTQTLVAEAKRRGGEDNISVILARVD
jgi:protein phosphatase